MPGQPKAKQELCYTDTGGTFTDTFIVDSAGDFIVAKAPSTPKDISIGYFDSLKVGAEKLGISFRELVSQLSVIGYGGTVTINTVLTRTGVKVGVIVTKGFEQLLIMERAKQTWVGWAFPDRTHVITHRRNQPLVPYHLMKGVTERVDCLGQVQIPLYEHEVRQAARELIDEGVEAIAICLLFCWQNPAHEHRCKEICEQVVKEMGKDIPIYCSVDVNPALREFPRLNTTLIEAYTAPRSKAAFAKMEQALKENGFKGALQIMQSSGGLARVGVVKVVETIESGPVGGLIGGRFIGNHYGFNNIITTDVGGTSFDVGLVTNGEIAVNREPEVARFLLSVPVAEVNSIGAGGGSLARLDPATGRLEVGPESAGAVPGPVCYDTGGETPTVTDADLILGYIDPDYFLGGRIKLNKKKAAQAIKEKIAGGFGLTTEQAALGIKTLLDVKMKDTLVGMVMARGLEIRDYYLLGFGGGGPTHVAGYTEGLPLKGIMCFLYSAAFSAFGASAADYEHHYTRATNIVVPPQAKADVKVSLGKQVNQLWQSLEEEAYQMMAQEGFPRDKVHLTHQAMIRYGRQLDDLIVISPVSRVENSADWDKLINAFEKAYEGVFAAAAKYPQAGYEIFEVGLIATVTKLKPVLRKHEMAGTEPAKSAFKTRRTCWFDSGAVETAIYQWEELQPGNKLNGPAILESATTNLVVPPGRSVAIDEYLTAWLK